MAQGRPPLSALGPVGEDLLVGCVAAEADGPLAGLRGSLALHRSLRRCFLTLTQADVSPVALSRMAARLRSRGEAAAGRVEELSRLYLRYRSLLSGASAKLDSGLAQLRRIQSQIEKPCAALSSLGLIALPDNQADDQADDQAGVRIQGLHRLPTWDGLPTLNTVLQACSLLFNEQTGRSVTLQLPQLWDGAYPEGPSAVLDAALKSVLEPIYERHALSVDIDWQPLGPALAEDQAESPWGRFVRGLFRPAHVAALVTADELPDQVLSIVAQPSPAVEAREVARRVRELVTGGVDPSDVAVVAEDPARRSRIEAALRRYGIPVGKPVDSRSYWDGGGRSDLPPPLSLPLSLYDLQQQGLPREGLLSVIASSYVRMPLPDDAADVSTLARALRGAGVRALAGSTPDELSRRIREWLRLQRSKQGKNTAGATTQAASGTIEDPGPPVELRQLSTLLAELAALPAEGTVRQHAQALLRLCERLRLFEQASGFAAIHADPTTPDPSQAPIEEADDRGDIDEWAVCDAQALARDQAAVAVLQRALQDLPTRAEALRLSEQRLSRPRFATLLRALCLRLWTDVARGVPPPDRAVQLAGLFDLPVQRRHSVFFVGLIEGEQPGSVAEDPLLGDDDRQLCNHLLGARVFPLSRHRAESAPLRFVELLAHASAAYLSYPRADEDGRPLLSSTFVAAALQAAGRDGLEASAAQPVASAARVPAIEHTAHPSELWLAAAPAFVSSAATDATVHALASALTRQERDRRGRLVNRLGVERARAHWFSSLGPLDGNPVAAHTISAVPAVSVDRLQIAAQAGAGPYSGQLTIDRLIAALSARLPGSAQRPLSASALEDYARCPFRFFVYRVLHAAPIEEGGDDLDPLTSGRLHHRVLEKFFAELRDSGRLPLRGDEAERALLLRVIDEVLVEFDESERTGHPTLFRARLRRLRSDLLQLIAREAHTPIEPGCLPTLLEYPFGPLRIAAQEPQPGSSTGDPMTRSSDDALHIAGVIDRIDIGPGRALVLDYKTGQIRRYQDYLRSELLVTSFQLPLYAAAVQADPRVQALAVDRAQEGGSLSGTAPASVSVSARYYAVRQAAVSAPLQDEGLFALSGPSRRQAGDHNVAEVAYRLWRRLRSGDFRVAPKTCEGCGAEAVCRIGTAALDRGLTDEPGESEATSQVTPSSRSSPSSTSGAASAEAEM